MAAPRPIPRPDRVSQGFWDAAARRELAIQRCAECGTYQHPPHPICRACGGSAVEFERVSGEGRLWSWTTTHHVVISGFDAVVPYTCMVIELAEQRGLFVLSDLIGREVAGLRTGAPMRVVFPDPPSGEPCLPQFAPAESAR